MSKEDPAKVRARAKAWNAANPGRVQARAAAFSCAYCLRAQTSLTVDHITPIARGGLDSPDNVVPACRSCNSKKGARLLIDPRVLSLGAA